jgi:hypothetical protein
MTAPVNKGGVLSVSINKYGLGLTGRTIQLGQYASSVDGRCELRMHKNGNLEWGTWLISRTGRTSVDVKYVVLAVSNTAVGEKKAEQLQYYGYYGPSGKRVKTGIVYTGEPPRIGSIQLQVRSRKFRRAVGSIGRSPNSGFVLVMQDDGNLISRRNDGTIVWATGPVAAASQPKMAVPNVNTLIIATPQVTIDEKGSRTITNDGLTPSAVFDGEKVHVLQSGEAINFSHTGSLQIFQITIARDYAGSSSADATARDIKTIPATEKVIKLSAFTSSLTLK